MSVSLTSSFLANARGITFEDSASVTWTFDQNKNQLTATGSGGGGGGVTSLAVGSSDVTVSASTGDITIDLSTAVKTLLTDADTALQPVTGLSGSYTSANLTINSSGQITAAANGTSGGGETYRATWVNGGLPLNASGALQVPLPVGVSGTLKEVTVLTLGGPGSCTVDIWKAAIASYPPTISGDITGGTSPAISSGKTYDNTTLSGWTTSFSAGDTLLLTLAASSSFTLVSITLRTG